MTFRGRSIAPTLVIQFTGHSVIVYSGLYMTGKDFTSTWLHGFAQTVVVNGHKMSHHLDLASSDADNYGRARSPVDVVADSPARP
jgi:hypothetical protein